MIAVMALMEIPGILIGIYLFLKYTNVKEARGDLLSKVFSTKSVVLILGGFVIGLAMNDKSWGSIAPVFQNTFKGVLAFFLLDLGVIAQRQLKEAWKFKGLIFPVGILLPLIFASFFLYLGHLAGLSQGDAVLLGTFAGSASYIAAPAMARSAIPAANPSLYLALPLALTFPMNLLIGIPFYIEMSHWLLR
jgi:uncharacterized protein